MIHIFLGTKAQYIKTAPVLRALDARGIEYRLIDSGQHAAFAVGLRKELGIREPDVFLAQGTDVTRVGQAGLWALRLAARLFRAQRLKQEVFGGRGGVCLVHGDTPSTLLATLMAKRASLRVAHLEAGLRSYHLFHPFPEELIRIVVMRLSDVLFAPDEQAVENLRRMRLRGKTIRLPGNTVIEALHRDLQRHGGEPGSSNEPLPEGQGRDHQVGSELMASGPVIVTMHRVENLTRRARIEQLVELLERLAPGHRVCFVQHGPTIAALKRHGFDRRIEAAGVEQIELMPHDRFVTMLAAAPFVITDGGSIQEECALLGVPTLLWRAATERGDGVGMNVVIGRYDSAVIEGFVRAPESWRRPPAATGALPSDVVIEHILPFVDPPIAREGC